MIAASAWSHDPNHILRNCVSDFFGGSMQILKAATKSAAMTVLACSAVLAIGAIIPAMAAEKAALKLPEIKYEKYILPNGLVVLTHEDHRLPLVAVDLWYHVGPLNEKAGRTGFAHLFEHMMFEGSEHVGEKAHIKFVQGAGATDVNGTTNFDRTNYFETMPSNQLELALWLESDRMGFLLEGLDRVKLTNQRDVVRNERRQGEGRPYAGASEMVYHLLFPQGHPYYGNVIGSHADIEAARINDVREFHQQFYTPNNASIAIAGDFKPAELKALLTKYFGPIPAGPKVEEVTTTTTPTPAITEQKRAEVTDTVKLDQVNIAFLSPSAYTPGDAAAQMAGYILGQSSASRLYEALVHKREMAQSAFCYDRPLKLTGVFYCSLTAKPGVKLADLEAAFWEEVAKIQKDGPTQQELDSARTSNLTGTISGLQRLGGFGGIADSLNEYNQYTGDPGYLTKNLQRYQDLKVGDIKDAATKYLNKNQAVVVTCVPGKKVVDDVPRSPENTDAEAKLTAPYAPDFEEQQNWRKAPPKAGPEGSFHLPVPTTFSLQNGLKVYVVRDPALPILTANVVSRAGGEANPTGKPGLADFTASMLSEGTATRTATQIAEDAEKLGTSIGVNAGMDSANSGVTVLTSNSAGALDLLADVLEHPAFHPEDLERIRKQRMVRIQQESDSVNSIGNRVGLKMLYGDQPYGFPTSGTFDSIKSLSREDLQSFWSGHYGPKDSALILVGDITEAEAKKLAEAHFGKWTGSADSLSGEVKLPPAPAAPSLKIVVADKPGSPQTALVAFGLGVPRSIPELEALQLMNYTLGASFGSRINMNLREEHGYTYGARSGYSLYREGGPFTAGGLVKTDVTAAATKELMIELRRIQTEPPTVEELKMARESSIQSIPGQFETTAATAGATSWLFIYNRPLDYYAKMPERYAAVTPEAVEQAAKTLVHPEQLLIVEAGDKAKIDASLKELNIPIVYTDATGNPIE
jgi:zinc protease